MAKVRSIHVTFPPSASSDVVGYKMYYVNTGTPLNYVGPSVDLGDPEVDEETGRIRIDISSLGVFSDGIYDIGVVAIDDAGNESSMSIMTAVPFDFVAPDAPGPVEIEVV